MPDYPVNPYLTGLDYTPEQRSQRLWGAVGNSLLGLGAGIAQGGASGQPWFAGIAPGLAMGSQMTAQQQQQQEAEQMRRFALGLQASEYQDKHDERQRLMKARDAYANGGPTPGMGVQSPTPQMGPGSYTAQVGGDESGGSYTVPNAKGSGAYGKYQFMPDTWAGVAKAHPDLNLPFNMKQATPDQQEAAMKAFTADNANSLKTAGFDPQPTNLYLAHRFGVGGASKVLSADPNTPISSLFPPVWTQQNPDLQGKTAGQFVAGAQGRYGTLPPFQGPGTGDNQALMPGPQVRPPDQVPAMTPAIAQGGSDSSPTPVQYQPNPQTPPPQMVAPPEPPVVPIPTVPPQIDQQLRQAVGAGLMTVDQAETKKAQIVRELHSHAQTQATQKFQRDLEVWKFNRGEAAKDVWRPLTPQERDQMLPGSRPDAQLQINSRSGEIKPVLSARDVKPDVSQYYQDPDVQKKIAAMSPSDRAAFNAAASTGDHKGASAILTKAQTGLTEEQQALSGDDLLKTLPFGDRSLVAGLVDGSLLPTDLSKRAGNGSDFNRLIALAKQVDSDYSPTEGGARRGFEKEYMGKGQGAQTVLAVNTAAAHMKAYHELADALKNGNSPLANTIKNQISKQFGNADLPTAESARTLLGTEIAKAVRGAGSLNESEEKAAQAMVNPNASPQQQQAALNMLTDFMMGRMHAIEDMAKARGVPDRTINNYMSPRAREAFDAIRANPIGGEKSGAANQPIKIDMSGKRQ